VAVEAMAPPELWRRAVYFRHFAGVSIDEAARAAALVLANEYEEEELATLQRLVDHAEHLVADQIARIKELDRCRHTAAAIIARHLLEAFETSLDLSKSVLRRKMDVCERAVADLD
jgi:hypothetical protein